MDKYDKACVCIVAIGLIAVSTISFIVGFNVSENRHNKKSIFNQVEDVTNLFLDKMEYELHTFDCSNVSQLYVDVVNGLFWNESVTAYYVEYDNINESIPGHALVSVCFDIDIAQNMNTAYENYTNRTVKNDR